MIVTLRRIITRIFGSAQVEQIDRIARTGAELAARRDEPNVGIAGQRGAPDARAGGNPSTTQPPDRMRRP